MLNQTLKDQIVRWVLPQVQTPAQYAGGELNMVRKDHRGVRGRVCLAFPDTYGIGMSCHGLQVLYSAMNRRDDWACERVFAPGEDFERLLRERGLPLYSLETFTPLSEFDLVGFTLQYELCYPNILTILDLGGIPLRSDARTMDHPLVVAGGPCVANPEPLAPMVDVFVSGDGETTLAEVGDLWLREKRQGAGRREALLALARALPYAYVPQLYAPRCEGGRQVGLAPLEEGIPTAIRPAVLEEFSAFPLPTRPIVPSVAAVQDRIAIEIMRGCPWGCRFCQSSTLKRPLRYRRVEAIVEAALESYRTTGYNEISLLSLSTSDYPLFEPLMEEMQRVFRPLDVNISVPSLRVNEQLKIIGELLHTERHSGFTLAPEAAHEDMRAKIGKRITNDDLFEGCRVAFQAGFDRVKLYFLCGLPGERKADLDGIVDLAEEIARLGKQVRGRSTTVVANISNFVPKPQTPFQWNGMQTRDYFQWAHQHLLDRRRLRSVELKWHGTESSLLEGVLARGDRRVADAIELVWRRGSRFDAWAERLDSARWWTALEEVGVDLDAMVHRSYPIAAPFAWDHMTIRQGRAYLEGEQSKSLVPLAEMA